MICLFPCGRKIYLHVFRRGNGRSAESFMGYDSAVKFVREVLGQECTILELRTAQSNIGQVVGKKGHLADAMRTLLRAVGMKEGRRYTLEILER